MRWLPIRSRSYVRPTDARRERKLGRIPVWLDVDHVLTVAEHCYCGTHGNRPHSTECLAIRFRAETALHKAGKKQQRST